MDLLIIQWSEIATTVSTHAPKLVLDKIRNKIDDSLCIPHAAVIKYTRTAIVSTGGSSLCNNKSNGPFYTPATVYSSPPEPSFVVEVAISAMASLVRRKNKGEYMRA